LISILSKKTLEEAAQSHLSKVADKRTTDMLMKTHCGSYMATKEATTRRMKLFARSYLREIKLEQLTHCGATLLTGVLRNLKKKVEKQPYTTL
jgi:hypothetical protein